ncbi:hypothetical protein LXA43DRAFT_1178936 [Ganoderma leucocontextum]|nr:hypothetical protein LXA43DRAFT_1178936 [Ganoderma leucocontextum]
MSSLYRALQIPCLPDAVDEWLSRGTVVPQPGSIGKLSTEVLDMVFQAILDDRAHSFTTNLLSCICLAVGCKRLLTVGKGHILEGLLEHHAPAAHCRLICLGESTDATDQAPSRMLTEEQLKEIAATKVPAEDDRWAIAGRNEDGGDPNVILEHPESESEQQQDPLHALDRKMVEEPASYSYREDALAVFRGGGGDQNRVTFVHAMVSRICYSLDPSVADELCGDKFVGRFGRGPWEGDRFCIRSEEDMPVPQVGWGFKG